MWKTGFSVFPAESITLGTEIRGGAEQLGHGITCAPTVGMAEAFFDLRRKYV